MGQVKINRNQCYTTSYSYGKHRDITNFTFVRIKPSKVAGHSLGQFSALVEAGSLQFSDALSIVRKRGQLMSNVKQEGCMLGIVSNTYQTLFEVVEESKQYEIDIAAYNSPTQVVFSGESKSILKFQKVLDQKNGIKLKYSQLVMHFTHV